jgi:hypothetical protein
MARTMLGEWAEVLGGVNLQHAKATFRQTHQGLIAFFVFKRRFGVWKGGTYPASKFKVWRALELMGSDIFGPFRCRHLGEDP